jgi:hypothetical protein
MTVTARKDDSPVMPEFQGTWPDPATERAVDQRAGGFSPNGTTAMVNRDTQLALPSSLVSRMSQTCVVRPM